MVQYYKYSRYSLSRVKCGNVFITDETVKRLRLGWTLCPAPLIVKYHSEIQFLSCFIWHFVNPIETETVWNRFPFTKCQIKQDRNCISLRYLIWNINKHH